MYKLKHQYQILIINYTIYILNSQYKNGYKWLQKKQLFPFYIVSLKQDATQVKSEFLTTNK
jgi:hypothetical protein